MSATCRAKIELATWSTRSTKTILGTIKRLLWIMEFLEYLFLQSNSTTRENKVEKLIKKFENHQHKEYFLQDLSQTQKINKFSKESQDLIADMNNTEIFELCENSSKSNATIVISSGKSALSIAAEEI